MYDSPGGVLNSWELPGDGDQAEKWVKSCVRRDDSNTE